MSTFKFVRSDLLRQRCFANISCNTGVSQCMGGPHLQCADLWPSSHTDQGIRERKRWIISITFCSDKSSLRLTPFSPSSHTDQGVCERKRWSITFRSDLSSLRLTPFTPSSNTDQGIREENMDHTNNFLLRQELFTFNTVFTRF